MGIGNQSARALLAAVKAGTTTKDELRAELAAAVTILNDKISAIDMQLVQAEKDFAASKKAQFNNFVATLPDVGDPLP